MAEDVPEWVSYSGHISFMRRPVSRDLTGVDIAVSGVPFDQSVTNRPGTRFGPRAVRQASVSQPHEPAWPWGFNPFDTISVTDYGDCPFDYAKPGDIEPALIDHIAGIIQQGAKAVTIGGDHFITYPILKAHAEKYGPLALVHFDAHRDVDPSAGHRICHGVPFARAVEEGLIDTSRSIQAGIRTLYDGEEGLGFTVIGADWCHAHSAAELAQRIRETVGEAQAYLTFDIDCLDPAFAPGTGTPVPGGLSTAFAQAVLRDLKDIDFIGGDLVEVSPPYDHAEITALAGAALLQDFLCLLAWRAGAR